MSQKVQLLACLLGMILHFPACMNFKCYSGRFGLPGHCRLIPNSHLLETVTIIMVSTPHPLKALNDLYCFFSSICKGPVHLAATGPYH